MDKVNKKMLKKIIYWLTGAVFLIPAALFLLWGNLLFDQVMERGSAAENNPAEDREWTVGYEDAAAKAHDGVPLYARIVTAMGEIPGKPWVLAVHGYGASSANMEAYAKGFADLGYNVILPDCRGHGRSGGEYTAMGWEDRFDIITWCNMLAKEYPQSPIALFGLSMGGTAVLNASGELLPENVKCVVADSAYSSVGDILKDRLSHMGLPASPLVSALSPICRMKNGFWIGEGDTVKQIERSKLPVLLIHGEDDAYVPADMSRRLAAAAGDRGKGVIYPGGHGETVLTLGNEYFKAIGGFLKENIDPEGMEKMLD